MFNINKDDLDKCSEDKSGYKILPKYVYYPRSEQDIIKCIK